MFQKLRKWYPLTGIWNKNSVMFFFVVIPIILAAIYLYYPNLPPSIQNTLVLYRDKPNASAFFLANYTHTGLEHFFRNIMSYFLLMFLLFNVEKRKKFFYLNSVLMLFLLPIAISLVSLQLAANNEPMKGFSGIVYGFAGYLLYSNIKNTNIRNFLNDICKKSNLKKQKKNSRFIYKSVVLLMALLYPFFALIEIMIPAHYIGYIFGIFVPFVMEKLCLKNAA